MIPDTFEDFPDGGLGLLAGDTDDVHLKIGVASAGIPLTIYSFSPDAAGNVKTTLDAGPLVESTVTSLAEGAPIVYAMPVAPSTPSAVTAVVLTGTGTSVLTTTGSTAKDAYDVVIEITRAGVSLVAATAAFRISLDGGDSWSESTAVPVSGIISSYAGNSGLVLTFGTGTFVLGDTYRFTTTAPALTLSDISAALDAAFSDERVWRFVHVVGAVSGTIAVGVSAKLQTAKTLKRYTRAILETRDMGSAEANATWQASLGADFASISDGRICVIAAPAETVSPISGQQRRVSAAAIITGRISRRRISEDAGRVRTGPLAGIVRLYHDERKTPGLNAMRFTTMRTRIGRAGFYITQGLTLAAPTSDYKFLQNGFVMDKAANIVRDGTLEYLNESLVVSPATGFIDEVQAKAIEADLVGKLSAGLFDKGDMSAEAVVTVKRNNNILATGQVFVRYGILPLAYGKYIYNELVFINPALLPKVAPPAPGQTAGGS